MTIDRTSDRRVAPGDGDRREQLLAAAARAIGRHGIENVRMLDVAREAGVSIGALQHHFYSRDLLIGEAVRAVALTTARAAANAGEGDGDAWSRLVGVVGSLTLTADARLDAAVWIELCAVASRHVEYRQAVQEVQHAWGVTVRRLLDEGVRRGEFALALPVRECVEAILAIADGVLLTAASGTRELSARQIERRVLATVAILTGRDP
jgi:AcrR family transcriptional regulator